MADDEFELPNKRVLLKQVRALGLNYPYRTIALLVLFAFVAAVAPLALPLLFGIVIDGLLTSVEVDKLVLSLIVIMVVQLIGAYSSMASTKYSCNIGYHLVQQLSCRVYNSLIRMPYLTYATMNQGVLISRLTNDVRMVEPLFVQVPITALKSSLTLLVIAVLLLHIDLRLAIAFLVVPISLALVRRSEARINSSIEQSFRHSSVIADQIQRTTTIDSILLVRQAGATNRECESFADASSDIANISVKLDFWKASVETAYEVSFAIISVAVLAVGIYLIQQGIATVGAVVSSLLFVRLTQQPLNELVGLRYPILRGSVGLGRLESVLESSITGLETVTKINTSDSITPQTLGTVTKDAPVIEFDNVSYRYPIAEEISVPGLSGIDTAISGAGVTDWISVTDLKPTHNSNILQNEHIKPWVLRGLSFSIRRGESIALAGKSGEGKSTAVALASSLIRPTKGQIRLNGQATDTLAEETIWERIALVSQDVFLHDKSLRENLLYVSPGSPDIELIEACRKAGLTDLLTSLPDGLDTLVGSNGKRFSGGEKQRISIARALLQDADLLILDEATSHLDSKRQQDILNCIEEIRADKAVLIVAHRINATAHADIILMLENGEVVETGSHRQLIKLGGPYAKMHNGGEEYNTAIGSDGKASSR